MSTDNEVRYSTYITDKELENYVLVIGNINLKYYLCNNVHLSLHESNKISQACYKTYTKELEKEIKEYDLKNINSFYLYRPVYHVIHCSNGNICIIIILPTESKFIVLLEKNHE